MLHKQYYVEKAKVDKLVARKIRRVIFTTEFMTGISIRS
mgnify:CR=1 FL=1